MKIEESISVDPHVCHGQPCFKGTRIMVYLVLELLEGGVSVEKILKEYYPSLTQESVQAALHYAAELVKGEQVIPFQKVA